MARDPVERVCRWHPVEPELTHFVDIISLTFDIGTDRGTSDTYRPFVERPSPGSPWPWQCAVLTFNGGPHGRIVPVRCTFDGLVYFNFVQDDFDRPMSERAPCRNSYDLAALQGVEGFNIQNPEVDSHGAFCLWECDSSPLIEDMVAWWTRGRPLEDRRGILRHFETSCDELGVFELVAGDVTIEQLGL